MTLFRYVVKVDRTSALMDSRWVEPSQQQRAVKWRVSSTKQPVRLIGGIMFVLDFDVKVPFHCLLHFREWTSVRVYRLLFFSSLFCLLIWIYIFFLAFSQIFLAPYLQFFLSSSPRTRWANAVLLCLEPDGLIIMSHIKGMAVRQKESSVGEITDLENS